MDPGYLKLRKKDSQTLSIFRLETLDRSCCSISIQSCESATPSS